MPSSSRTVLALVGVDCLALPACSSSGGDAGDSPPEALASASTVSCGDATVDCAGV